MKFLYTIISFCAFVLLWNNYAYSQGLGVLHFNNANTLLAQKGSQGINQYPHRYSQVQFPKNSPKYSDKETSYSFGMIFGAGYNNLRFVEDTSFKLNLGGTLTKAGGISLEFPILSLNERFTVYNELAFNQFSTSKTTYSFSDTIAGEFRNVESHYTFTPNIINLSHSIRYFITSNDFKYYFSVGLYNNFIISAINKKENTVTTNTGTQQYKEYAIPNLAIHGIMILASTGFTYKNIGLELRFDPGRNFSNKFQYYVYSYSLSAILNIRLNMEK